MKVIQLADIALPKGLVGGPFGSSLVGADYQASGVPVIRGQNLSHGRHIAGEFAYVSEEKYERDLARNSAEAGDLIFTQRGTLGQVAILKEGTAGPFVVSQSQMRLRVDPDLADAQYVYYAATAPEFLAQVADNAISAGVPHINLGILSRLLVRLPTLEIQRSISATLGALDDKIATNTTLARTADELIRARYQLISEQSDEVRHLSELVAFVKDGKNPETVEASTRYVGLEHMPRRSIWLSDSATADKATSAKSAFSKGDVLFGKLRPYFHKVVLAPTSGICSTDILVCRAKDPRMTGYAIAALSSDAVVERCSAMTEGTRMPRTSWQDLASTEVPWPGQAAASRFTADAAPLIELSYSLVAENHMLANLRDALLPRLMSGELSVRDAEAEASEVL